MLRWVEDIVRSRSAVAALGERSSPIWWRSQAMSDAGRQMLAYAFPRTSVAASLELACRAARIQHDAHIGESGVFHLFRLPQADESLIRDALRSVDGARLLAELVKPSADQRAALRELAEGTGGGDVPPMVGPYRIGSVASVRRRETIRRICAAYEAGFTSGHPVYPYLVNESAL